jgi:hypothetical protein
MGEEFSPRTVIVEEHRKSHATRVQPCSIIDMSGTYSQPSVEIAKNVKAEPRMHERSGPARLCAAGICTSKSKCYDACCVLCPRTTHVCRDRMKGIKLKVEGIADKY